MPKDVEHDSMVWEVRSLLCDMSLDQRLAVLNWFCRSCGACTTGTKDWSGQNYCNDCSPSSKDDE